MTEKEKKQQAEAAASEAAASEKEPVTAITVAQTVPQGATEGPKTESKPAEGEPKPSAKERYHQRYAAAYPDMNADDEEAFYGKANENLDELEGYRKNNKELSDAFGKNPTLSAMLIAAKDGENPFVWLGENLGMDIRELSDDPQFGKKLGDALIKYQEQQSAGKQAQQEIQDNFSKSIDELESVSQETGLSDEEKQNLYTKFFEEIVDPATRGIVSKYTWALMRKGMKYDSDMETAAQKASAKALNQKIENKVTKSNPSEMPPTLSTGNGAEKPMHKRGGFFSDMRDV